MKSRRKSNLKSQKNTIRSIFLLPTLADSKKSLTFATSKSIKVDS